MRHTTTTGCPLPSPRALPASIIRSPRRRTRAASTTLAALAALTTLAACSDAPSAPGGAARDLDLARLAGTGAPEGILADGARERRVVTDVDGWRRFRVALGGGTSLGELPASLFDEHMLLAAATPTRPTGGHSIRIERVTERADRIEATVVERAPGAGCVTTAAISRAVDVVRVRRSTKPVHFVEREETVPCEPGQPAGLDTLRVTAAGTDDAAASTRLTLREVVRDDRCPIDAFCIAPGDAVVVVRFARLGATEDATLHTSPAAGRSTATVGGVTYRLIGLTPAPGSREPGEPTAILVRAR